MRGLFVPTINEGRIDTVQAVGALEAVIGFVLLRHGRVGQICRGRLLTEAASWTQLRRGVSPFNLAGPARTTLYGQSHVTVVAVSANGANFTLGRSF